jgi:signal transduction histidine kinase
MAFKMPEFETAYALYVNGRLVGENGVVGRTPAAMRPQWLPKVVDFSTGREQVEVILQISNFYHKKGGAGQLIYFGPESLVREARERALSYELFLFGNLFVMGFYHIALFALRSQDKSPFYFGLSCLLVALRILVTGEHCLVDWLPDISWRLVVQLNYLSFTLTVPIFVMFTRELFTEGIPLEFVRGLQGVSLAFAGLIILTPTRIFTYALQPYQVVTLIAVVYFVFLLIRMAFHAYKLKRPCERQYRGIAVFLLGVFVLLFAMINDILYNNHLIRTGYFAPVGIFVFVFAQAFLLAQRFSSAFAEVEVLSKEMEQRVVARTEQLATSNQQLLDANADLQREIFERERAQAALREAKKEAEAHARSAEAASRAKSIFIANMSHELRTPLNAVIGFSQLVAEAPNLTAEQRNNLEVVVKNSENLLDLINDVLDISQAGSENLTLGVDADELLSLDAYAQFKNSSDLGGSGFAWWTALTGSGRSIPSSLVKGAQETFPMISSESVDSEAKAEALPAAWVAQMRQATFDADFKLMLDLVDQIREQYPVLADELTELVNRFDYIAVRKFIRIDEDKEEDEHG